jgi:hypothetical protein
VRRALAIAFVLALGASPAHAFVRSRTENNGNSLKFWGESCIPVTIYLNGLPERVNFTHDAVVKSIAAAAHAWSPDVVQCNGMGPSTRPFIEIVPSFAPFDAKPPAAGGDHKNIVVFRTEGQWSRNGSTDPKKAFADSALAVTTVAASLDGKILDADIEIHVPNPNADPWVWANLDPGVDIPLPPSSQQLDFHVHDLQTALTHEFGHLLGLEHTCFNPATRGGNIALDGSTRPRDDRDREVPDCSPRDELSTEIQQSVMFPTTEDLDTSKRKLSLDEIKFLCTVYPEANDPGMCRSDQPAGGCETAPERSKTARARALGLGVVGALALLTIARRARARRLSARARARA